jgi:hypothetical protein
MAAQHIQFFAHPINQFAVEHTDLRIVRKELCNLGLFLVFFGASAVLSAIPQQFGGENAFVGFALFILGIMQILLSYSVHLFPRIAAVVDFRMKQAIFVTAGWLMRMYEL